ncbi:hypothetical protein CDD83_5519 [Cordyceps sp. RAO-2017]|nr:hypothetical protein CDD83_5519 [Cordyceps sp. RAO-2017]
MRRGGRPRQGQDEKERKAAQLSGSEGRPGPAEGRVGESDADRLGAETPAGGTYLATSSTSAVSPPSLRLQRPFPVFSIPRHDQLLRPTTAASPRQRPIRALGQFRAIQLGTATSPWSARPSRRRTSTATTRRCSARTRGAPPPTRRPTCCRT